ncbi:MAG TPA: hypothetical protein VL426_06335 [Candidatus Binatia bacterium]|jgi:hypothetical protein|nr:hypothetical protein [Candidatus Binatia bacterium]
MKSAVSLLLLVAAMPVFIFIACLGHPFLACMLMFAALALNVKVMLEEGESYEVPACEHCGLPLEEGSDMTLEDGFEEDVRN